MATVLNQFDSQQDEKDKDNPGQGTNPTLNDSPSVGGPQGGGVATPGTGSSSSGGTSSGRFNNIRKYMDANKDFNKDQGGLAGQIVGNVNTQAENVKNNVQGASNLFNTQSQQALSPFQNTDLVNKAFEDPTSFVQDQDKLKQFSNIRDANYQGPKNLQDLSGEQGLASLQNQANQVQDTVNQGQTEGGRFNLLKTMYGNSNYTPGQQNLDNLLLQSNKDQLKKLQGARQTAFDVNQNLGNAAKAAEDLASTNQGQVQQQGQAVQNQLNQTAQQTLDANASKYNQAKQQQDDYYNQLVQASRAGTLDQTDLSKIHSNEGANFFDQGYLKAFREAGIDPSSLISKTQAPTEQNVLGADDYSRMNALNTLMGGSNGAIAAMSNPNVSAALGKYLGNESQAGGYDPNKLATYDQNQFSSDVGQARAVYLDKAQPVIDSLQSQYNQLMGYKPQVDDALKTAKQQYDNYVAMGLQPEKQTDAQILNWYGNNVQRPQELASQAHAGEIGYQLPSNYINYADLVKQIQDTSTGYGNTRSNLQNLNSNFGNVFDYYGNAAQGGTNGTDPLALLYSLGAQPAGSPTPIGDPFGPGPLAGTVNTSRQI